MGIMKGAPDGRVSMRLDAGVTLRLVLLRTRKGLRLPDVRRSPDGFDDTHELLPLDRFGDTEGAVVLHHQFRRLHISQSPKWPIHMIPHPRIHEHLPEDVLLAPTTAAALFVHVALAGQSRGPLVRENLSGCSICQHVKRYTNKKCL